MKILMQIRKDVKEYPGGDFIQLLKTKKYLEKLGINVDVSHSWDKHLKYYDMVHLFNVTRITETYLFFQNAKKQNKKIVISPIYHSLQDMEDFYRYHYRIPIFNITAYLSLKEIFYPLRSKNRLSGKCIFQYKNTVKQVLKESELILPNSSMEHKFIKEELKVDNQYLVIPNAAEIPNPSGNRGNLKKNIILCVGRIEPRKNQLKVIEAFIKARPKLPQNSLLKFAGSINKSQRGYYKKFLRATKKYPFFIQYIGPLTHQEIMQTLQETRLLVLASFFETTGLVGLEALSCGSNVVITDRGYTKEYYGKSAVYCNPYSIDSINEAMIKGFYQQFNKKAVDKLIEKFSWENAARLTLKGYEKLIN